jgi:hypothetical protein
VSTSDDLFAAFQRVTGGTDEWQPAKTSLQDVAAAYDLGADELFEFAEAATATSGWLPPPVASRAELFALGVLLGVELERRREG